MATIAKRKMQMEHCPIAPKPGSNAMEKSLFPKTKTFWEKLWRQRLGKAIELTLGQEGEIGRYSQLPRRTWSRANPEIQYLVRR